MPIQKTPAADLKRRYPQYAEAGLALALGATILAFTLPSPPPEVDWVASTEDPVITLVPVPQTREYVAPPPPPPAPPPPVEVPDNVVVDAVLEALDMEVDAHLAPPPAPPGDPTPAVAPPPSLPAPMPPPAPPPTPPTVSLPDPAQEVFTIVEQPPVLIGGLAALQSAVTYPVRAQRVGIEGRVIVEFVVDERGAVTNPVVVRSPSALLSDAALDAVRRIAFEPGQQRGRPVKVRMTVPVTFRLR